MKRNTEQLLADELDALITAKLHNQPLPPVEHVPESEVRFASALVDLATATQPDPDFTINLAAQLERAAHPSNRKRQSAPQRPSFWEQLTDSLRSNAMKKSIFALGAVAIVILAGVFFWNRSAPTTEPAVTDSGTTTTTDGGTAVADLPLLPNIKGDPNAMLGGLGGGGGDGTMMETAASEADIMPMPGMWPGYTDVFSGTQFSLNVNLPTEPTTAPVQQHNYENLTAEQAQQIATSFGFDGPVYLQVVPVYENQVEPGVDAVIYEPPPSYHVFDDQRELIMQQNSFYYMDRSLQLEYDHRADVPNAQAIAEAFLQEKGFLNFPYIMEQGYMPGEINFFRIIHDGAVSSMADFYVQVAPNGEIIFASANQFNQQIEVLGDYPLITPAEAWELIVSGVISNGITFNAMPDFENGDYGYFEPEDMPRYWSYQPVAGQEGRFYGSPTVYAPTDGNGRPRIDYMGYILNGSDADLQAIAEHPYEMMVVIGTITGEKEITVTSWELMLPETQPIFLEGTIGREGRDIIVTGLDGQTYILPNPPEDLPVGLDVYVFGWQSRDIGEAYPALDWQNIDERIFYPEEPHAPIQEPSEEPLEEPTEMDLGMIYTPYVYQTVVIDQITLEYYYMPQFAEEMSRGVYRTPPGLQLPVWKFSGQTDNNEQINFFVQAVDPAYLAE